ENSGRFVAGLAARAYSMRDNLSLHQPAIGPTPHIRRVSDACRPRTPCDVLLWKRLPHARAHHRMGIGVIEAIVLQHRFFLSLEWFSWNQRCRMGGGACADTILVMINCRQPSGMMGITSFNPS